GLQRQPGRHLPGASAARGGRADRRVGAARQPQTTPPRVPPHPRRRGGAPGVAGAARDAGRRGAPARRADAPLRVPGLRRRFTTPDAGLPREPGDAPGRLPRRAGAAARGPRRGVAPRPCHPRPARPRSGHLLHRGPTPLGARGPCTALDHRRERMSDIVAEPSPTTAAVGGSAASTAGRTAVLALGLFTAMGVGSTLAGLLVPSVGEALAARQQEGSAGAAAVAFAALLQALMLAPTAARARPGRWRAALGIGGAYWLITPVLMQIESAVFLAPVLPDGFLLSVGISVTVIAATAGVLAATLFGRRAGESAAPRHQALLDPNVSVHGWVARLVAICVIYILLYLLAGAFIALRDPALQAFYDQIGMPSLGTIFGV